MQDGEKTMLFPSEVDEVPQELESRMSAQQRFEGGGSKAWIDLSDKHPPPSILVRTTSLILILLLLLLLLLKCYITINPFSFHSILFINFYFSFLFCFHIILLRPLSWTRIYRARTWTPGTTLMCACPARHETPTGRRAIPRKI